MKNKLIDIVFYTLSKFKNKDDASNARVTKIVYLSDWHQALHYNKKFSGIDWYFDNYGPYVKEIKDVVKANSEIFTYIEATNPFGQPKSKLGIKDRKIDISLTKEEMKSIDHILNITEDLDWNGFIKLVYSTYPIRTSQRYSGLNLLTKAQEYKSIAS
jgi:hypothetical protein